VIDKAIEFVSRGLILGNHFGLRAIGVKVAKQCPGTDTEFGSHQMSVEILRTCPKITPHCGPANPAQHMLETGKLFLDDYLVLQRKVAPS
jgi:hypothetical protein